MSSTRPDRATASGWRKIWIDPPPRGRKLYLLTKGRTATVGEWSDDCLAWAPLFTLDDELNEFAFACYMGKRDEFLANKKAQGADDGRS